MGEFKLKYYMEKERGKWWLMKEGEEKSGIMLYNGDPLCKRKMSQLCDWLNNVPIKDLPNYLEIEE